MSEKKKDLKAFLSKQSKKGKKPSAAAEPEKQAEEETKVAAEVIKKEKTIEKAQKADSDEELDDAEETGMDLGFAKIKEMKDIKVDNQQDEIEKKGYGFDESAKAPVSKGKDFVITRNTDTSKAAGGGDITFGGKPMKFGRRKTNANAIDGFDDGLGDIDDDGKIKKTRGTKNTTSGQTESGGGGNTMSGASGGREFIHFGSKPREHRDDKDEEAKDEGLFKSTGVKPTFKRREPKAFKAATDGDDVRPSYDFKVSYKTSYDDKDENGEKRERRQPRDKGVDIDTFNKKDEEEDDEFQFVTGRVKRAPKANNDDSDEDKMKRGDDQPNHGRGGFFKNSKKAE